MEQAIEGLLTAFAGFFAASGGFWLYLKNRSDSRDIARNANTALLMGLAQDKILSLGMKYINQGYVTKDEYEDLEKYLFRPYQALGGNGTAERIMRAVERLPFRDDTKLDEIAHLPIRKTDRIYEEENR